MLRPAITEILGNDNNYYAFVLSVAKRARDIVDENIELNEVILKKPVQMAVEQFKDKKYVMCNNYVEKKDHYKKGDINKFLSLTESYEEID